GAGGALAACGRRRHSQRRCSQGSRTILIFRRWSCCDGRRIRVTRGTRRRSTRWWRMSADLEPLLKRLHLANARRVWSDLVQRAEKEDWSYELLLHTLFAEEVARRRGTRLNRAVRAAAFPFLRTIDEFDFTYQSTLRLTTIGSLLVPDFVTDGRSVILHGKPGRGKTHLAIAIAYRAMQNGFDARFTTAAELI